MSLDPYFISAANLKDLGLITGNVDDKLLNPVIMRVQRSVVRPVLGTSLYKRICTGIDGDNLNANELTLMNDYVIPLMVVACDRGAINATTYQIRNKGTGKATDTNFQAVTESENLRLDNDFRLSIKIERDVLIGYLLDNCDLYPEYDSGECNYENIKPDKKQGRNNNFALI